MADESGSSNDLKLLAERKSRELYEIQEMRIEKLEHALEEKEKQIIQLAEERQAVLKDYQYNLQLLEERDKQFTQFEAVITEVRSQLQSKNRSISDLKITIDRQKEKLSLCDAVLDQERKRLQKRLLEQKEQVETYIRAKEESVEAERKQTEVTRRKYQQRLLEVEADLDSQKTHMLAQFDGVLRQREHEYRCKLDELSSALESRDQKLSSVSSECASFRAEVASLQKELDDRTMLLDEEERRGQEVQWRLQEEANMYRGRAAELEVEVKHGADRMVQLLKEHETKVNKLDGMCRQKDLMLRNAVQSHKEAVLSLEKEQSAAEKTILEEERVVAELQAALRQQAEEAAEEVERLKTLQAAELDRHRRELSRVQMEMREKERQGATLEKQCDILKMDLQGSRQEVARYKAEILQYLEKEKAVEQARAQLELDHQLRLEETERNICQQNEAFIKELSSAKEKTEGEVLRLRKGLAEAQRRAEEYKQERDVAMKGHKTNEHGKEDHQEVLQQNQQLRSVIAAMKEEMEKLSRPSAHQRSSSPFDAPITKGYVHYLEQEVTRLKLANQLVGKSADAARATPSGAVSHGGGWEGEGEEIVQQALLTAMKTEEALRQQEGSRMLEMSQKIKSLEAALKHANPDAPATHMNRLKLKLLRASLIIAELVREKEKLASIVKTLVSHLGTPRPHLEHSTPQGPTPHSIHTAHKEHTPHPTHLVPVTKGESESERSESSSRPPPSGRLSSGRQERGVQFDGPPLGEEGGNRTGRETPPFGDEVRQDVGDGDQRKECPVPSEQHRAVSEVSSRDDLDLSVSLSTLRFEDSLRLSRDREEFQSLMNDILTPHT